MIDTILSILAITIIMAICCVFVYGLYLIEEDRDKFRKEHGFDPWRNNNDIT